MRKTIALVSIKTQKDFLADFMFYFMDALKSVVDEYYLICFDNMLLKNEKMQEYNIFGISENISGSDVNRWKYGLSKYCSTDEKYKSILLLDDSCYGPVTSFDKVWNSMVRKACDVWGITKQMVSSENVNYIEPYFLVFRSKRVIETLLEGSLFLDNDDNIAFSKRIEYEGFKTDAYVDLTDVINQKIDESFLLYDTYELVSRFDSPFVPRFLYSLSDREMQFFGNGFQRIELLEYIKNRYPVQYIYSDLIKQHSMKHLVNALGLNFIINNRETIKQSTEYKDVAIFIYLFYEKDLDYYLEKINKIPSFVDVYILSPTISKRRFRKCEREISFVRVPKRGREWAAYLIEAKKIIVEKKYNYVGFLHDKSFHQNEFPTQAYDFRNMLWDNLCLSSNGIDSILSIFQENQYIGVLMPPIVKHGSYFKLFMDFWTLNYDISVKLANMLGIGTELIKREDTPLSIGSMFWFKYQALETLLSYEFCRDDFPDEPMEIEGTINHALERIIPFVAQDNGFYSAFISDKRWAEYDNLLLAEMLRETNKECELDFYYYI